MLGYWSFFSFFFVSSVAPMMTAIDDRLTCFWVPVLRSGFARAADFLFSSCLLCSWCFRVCDCLFDRHSDSVDNPPGAFGAPAFCGFSGVLKRFIWLAACSNFFTAVGLALSFGFFVGFFSWLVSSSGFPSCGYFCEYLPPSRAYMFL